MSHTNRSTTFADLVDILLAVINALIPLVFGLAVIVIIWKLIDHWIIHGGNAESTKAGGVVLITGIIVLALLVSVWGIVYFLRSTFLS